MIKAAKNIKNLPIMKGKSKVRSK